VLDETLARFLELTASDEPAPSGGAVAAVTVAMAAALCAMVARRSGGRLADAPALVARADELRSRAALLAPADAEAYAPVLEAVRSPAAADAENRRRRIQVALSAAADVPLDIVEVAVEVTALAATLAVGGNPGLRGDALVAAVLAEAGARAAGSLVEIDLSATPGDGRLRRLRELLAAAEEGAAAAAGAADEAAPRSLDAPGPAS
jgi:formiminotetrahydrofolate cyclodeaminase